MDALSRSARRLHHGDRGFQRRIPVLAERAIELFARKPGLIGDPRHALDAGHHTEHMKLSTILRSLRLATNRYIPVELTIAGIAIAIAISRSIATAMHWRTEMARTDSPTT